MSEYALEFRDASRKKIKIRLGLSSVSNGGKTISALLIAYGMTGDWQKIAVIDVDGGRSDLYVNHTISTGVTIGKFKVVPLSEPYHPEKFVQAIAMCEANGMEVIIIDPISPEWDGQGGCLDLVEKGVAADDKHNSMLQWAKVSPRHQKFMYAIINSKCHVITTVRRKQDYEIVVVNGKTKVNKIGTKEITRDGFEYELTVNLEIDTAHMVTVSKDNTGLFEGKPAFIPTVETGKAIKEWCELGIDFDEELKKAIGVLSQVKYVVELEELKKMIPPYISVSNQFKEAFAEIELRLSIIAVGKAKTATELTEIKRTLPAHVVANQQLKDAGNSRFYEIQEEEKNKKDNPPAVEPEKTEPPVTEKTEKSTADKKGGKDKKKNDKAGTLL